jgi:lysophospholipase L1-like esterase
MRVLVFGTSITQGFWDTEGGWVARLRKYYDTQQVKDFSKDNPTIFNLGISADTTTDILRRFEAETQARAREEMAIVFDMGLNDSAIEHGKERCSPDEYKNQVEQLITKATKYTDKIMFVGLTPCDQKLTDPVPKNWHENLSYTKQRISMFEKVLQDTCDEHQLPHVALLETLQSKVDSGENLLADGLHPNNDGHELIYQLVRPELDKFLAS